MIGGGGSLKNYGDRFRNLLAGSRGETSGVGTGTSRFSVDMKFRQWTEENPTGNREKQNGQFRVLRKSLGFRRF